MKRLLAPSLATLWATFALLGCAPGLGNNLDLDHVNSIKLPSAPKMSLSCSLGLFKDSRSDSHLVEISGRRVYTTSNLPMLARSIMEDQIRDAGGQVTISSNLGIQGEVLTWKARVTPGFPSSIVNSEAKIRLVATDQTGRTVHSSIYAASSSSKEPFLSEGDIKDSLARAMQVALNEALYDLNAQNFGFN